MRMTNEEFQAEVFRRSKVYQQQRQVRRRTLRTGALVFAGCLVIAAVGILPRMNRNLLRDGMSLTEMATAEQQNVDGAHTNGIGRYEDSKAAGAEAGDEAMYDMEIAEEACGEVSYSGVSDESAAPQGSFTTAAVQSAQPENAVPHAASPAKSDSAADADDSTHDADFLAMLGITAMPEQLGGCALDSESADGVYRYSDGDRQTAVMLSPSAMPESYNSVEIYYDITADGDRIAWFYHRGIHVRIYAEGCTDAELKIAAEELLTYLEQEGLQ